MEVPRRLIRMFSFAGDTVVDPFCGTGTTTLAALETGRNSIAVEVVPEYVDLAVQRIEASNIKGLLDVVRSREFIPGRTKLPLKAGGRAD
jgi:DNA modification methylase